MIHSPEVSCPAVELLEKYYDSELDDSGKENFDNSQTITTKKSWHCDGKGKYKDDYERLLSLVPESGKADSVAGEVMRAVVKLNRNCSTRSALYNSLDALNYIAMAGVFDENNSNSLATIHRIAQQPGVYGNSGEIENAIALINDRSIEFLLRYPDLEYFENTIDMSALYKSGNNYFVERVISSHAAMAKSVQSAPPNKELTLQITTPRTSNRMTSSISLRT